MIFKQCSVFFIAAALLGLTLGFAASFTPRILHYPRHYSKLLAASDPIIERARERAGVPASEDPPKIFEDDLLLDMQNVLRTLESRVKEGPEALSDALVDDMAAAVQRIVEDMKINEHKRLPRPSRHEKEAETTPQPQQKSPESATTVALPSPPISNNPSGSLLHAEPEVIQSLKASVGNSDIVDASEDEGPLYAGIGGMGQPKGTINTYVIPGMDEMTPEEYQMTLQQSIIDRQARRRASGGLTGNRSSSSYLDSL